MAATSWPAIAENCSTAAPSSGAATVSVRAAWQRKRSRMVGMGAVQSATSEIATVDDARRVAEHADEELSADVSVDLDD